MNVELAIVEVIVASSALVVGRGVLRTWRRARAPQGAGGGCSSGGCGGCSCDAPEPPQAQVIQLRRKS